MNSLLMQSNSSRIHIVGVEPGAASLGAEAAEAVSSCDVLVSTERHLDLVPGFAGQIVLLDSNILKVVEKAAADKSQKIAFLASGDPGFYGVAGLILRNIPRSEVKIWPAVSSMQSAFSRIKETWSDARFISIHGRPLENLASVLGASKIGIFTDAKNSPGRISQFLLEAGWDDLEMVVAEDLGLESERILIGPPSDFASWDGSPLNLVLLFRRGPDERLRGPGIADSAFIHKNKLITKAEVRSVALGFLHLKSDGVFWDVGAGSASVAIEACLLAPGLRAFAVEKDEESFVNMKENKRKLKAAGLICLNGEAPRALEELPPPDSVFIGGTGGDPIAVMNKCWSSLKPGGIMVASCVLIETLCDYMAWAKTNGVEPEISQIAFSRSHHVGERHMFKPQNTVMLFKIVKPTATPPRGSSSQIVSKKERPDCSLQTAAKIP